MKIILAALAAVALTVFGQSPVPDSSGLLITKFSCGRYNSSSPVVRSVQDPDPPMNEPIRITQIKGNEPQEVINRRDLQERRAEMKAAEINAASSKDKGSTIYFYRLNIRNATTKLIKTFAWSYQPGDAPDPSDRQFFCVVKAKAGENKAFELFTPLPPSRVIDASKSDDKSAKDFKDRVMVNEIEYSDGSVWRRPGWNPKTFQADDRLKVETGKCIGL